MSLLEISNIRFHYKTRNADNAFCLGNISLGVNKGEFISILGPNGSGKSTLLKIISGILRPDTGKISLKGHDIVLLSHKELAKAIAFVPQTFSVAFPFSVYEIVMMGRTPHLNSFGYEKEVDIEKTNEAMNNLDIYHLRKKGINEVSGGEAQRAFIARALAQDPEILLLDEPNSHLDIQHQISIYKILEEMNLRRNITIIIISHDLNLAGYFGKRILLMNKGEIVMDDIPRNILTEEHIKNIFGVDSSIKQDETNNTVSVTIAPKLN